MPDRTDPYAHHAEDQAKLRQLVGLTAAGTVAGGIFGYFRNRQNWPGRFSGVAAGRALRRRPELVTGSEWWWDRWDRFEEDAGHALRRTGRRAATSAIEALEPQYRRGLSVAEAEDFAADHARALRVDFEARTVEGLRLRARTTAHAKERQVKELFVARRLEEQIGPTRKQWRDIARWEKARIAEGKMSARQIARGMRRRADRAIALRARAFASNAIVAEDSAVMTEVYRRAGLLVFSWNPLDDDTREDHASQTYATRANPTPAGAPWAAAAPLSGLPPYAIFCRCQVREAGASPDRKPAKVRKREAGERREDRLRQRRSVPPPRTAPLTSTGAAKRRHDQLKGMRF